MVLNSWFFGVAGLLLLAAAPSAPATIGAEMKSMDKDDQNLINWTSDMESKSSCWPPEPPPIMMRPIQEENMTLPYEGPEKAVTETVPAVVGAGVAKPRAIGGANLTHPEGALDDVSMEEDARQCFDGQIVDRGCDQRCKCIDGLLQCTARCAAPLLRIGTPTGDPDCFLQPVPGDECCSTLVCSSEGESFSSDGCWYKNQTYKTGEIFHDGCDLTCTCREDGTTNCTARCSPQNNTMTSDRCLSVADPKDSCCTVLYCDVNAADEGLDEDVDLDHPKLISAIPANSSTVMLNFDKMSVVDKVDAEISLDQKQWKHATSVGQAVIGLEPGKTYYFRVTSGGGMNSNVVSATLPTFHPNSTSCEFKGKQYEIGEEFHDNCTAYCICSPSGIECASIDCPTDFGLDVLDPTCLEWETVPPGFKPQPPHCCPKSVKCKNNGSCIYKGNLFENWQDIPDKLSGCQEKCFCSSGNITCRQRCSEVPETPPTSLNCNSKQAIMGHSADDECCPAWVCPSGNGAKVMNSSINETITVLPKGGPNTSFLGPYNPDHTTTIKIPLLAPSTTPTLEENTVTSDHSTKANSPTILTSTQKPSSVEVNDIHPVPSTVLPPPGTKPGKLDHPKKKVNSSLDVHYSTDSEGQVKKIHSKPSSFFNPITASPDIPIGIINPDKLKTQDTSKENTVKSGHSKGPTVNPAFLEHLLEYHKYKEDEEQHLKVKQPVPPSPGLMPFNPNPPSGFNSNAPLSPLVHINPGAIHPNNIQPPYNQQHPQSVKPNENEDYDDQSPYVTSPEQGGHQQLIPPELYHLINQGYRDPYSQPNRVAPPQMPHQFLSPTNLFHVNRPHTPQSYPPQPPYNNKVPARQENNLYSHPNAPVGLAGIIDHIKQHEKTDSRTKDTHVYVLASQPPNVGQATQHIGLGVHQPNDPGSIAVHHLEAMDDGTVRLIFSVHPVLVGFHGRVELRYTADPSNNDISTWDQQVLAPPDDMIATPELEFELKGLMPDTEYRIKVTVVMRDLENSPTSPIVSVRTLHRVTPELSTTTLPPIIPVEPMMRITKVNSTWATVEWRTFTDYELQFIDGVQLRYKEIDGKVYQATPLIHRAVTSYTIEDLKPESQYEVGIFFIPFPEQSTELQALKTLFFNTTIENDPFKFELILDLHHLKSSSVEITWSGVPYPEDKYVNIFRAIYQYEGGREDMNTFKVAKRDSPAGTLITGLKPETRYRMWLEAYLTNGRIKKSNVKDFTTTAKAYSAAEPQEGKLESTPVHKESDYYGPLVGVSILAAITTLATVGLLVIIAKKHGHNKAPISAAVQRKSAPHTAAYDNPSYKSEMQHETMDL